MPRFFTSESRQAIFALLDYVMNALLDDAPLDLKSPLFGQFKYIDQIDAHHESHRIYVKNGIPAAEVKMTTFPDPLDLRDDRSATLLVPGEFEIHFWYPVSGLERKEIEKHLNLEKFWIASDGTQFEGNSLPPIPPSRMHFYRYRAAPHANSRFPVDVELAFSTASDDSRSINPKLHSIKINRAYPVLTPEMRKRKREEERQRKRETYGYRNLCTGDTCPESGIWEGWTPQGPTDVLRVEKGRPFDVVRTVAINQSAAPCPMIAGQWMWLCSLEEQNGFIWNGIALKG